MFKADVGGFPCEGLVHFGSRRPTRYFVDVRFLARQIGAVDPSETVRAVNVVPYSRHSASSRRLDTNRVMRSTNEAPIDTCCNRATS
jgi:hypothetical protein